MIMWHDGSVNYPYGGDHVAIYKCIKSTLLYTLDLHTVIVQLYLNKNKFKIYT